MNNLNVFPCFSANPYLPTKRDLEKEIIFLKRRLKERNHVIDTIRKAYNRDLLYINENDDKHKPKANVPSLDMRTTLELFAPDEGELYINRCSSCGGQLEIKIRSSKKLNALRRQLADMNILNRKSEEKIISLASALSAMETNYESDVKNMSKAIAKF